ncbi:unnamed protein product [Knipowitschia caucasica]|uniref:PLA2c domain-containing protein n=1 Tax=Knipowitschia caucasica TaxID=637954 RepID=A0AAV2KLW6_KNICA
MEHRSQTVVHRIDSVSSGEQRYIQERKLKAAQALTALGFPCSQQEVPHVALLASGGGQRAAVALVGSLHQLQKDSLLDTLLYLGGVSGSTWSMASLYSDPDWSQSLGAHMASLVSAQNVGLDQTLSWVQDMAQREDFSLTDVWGALTSAGIMKQWDTRKLSGEAQRNASNPYPVYGAIEKRCFNQGPIQGSWFELSPHEVGFPELGVFVETWALGSKFQNGTMREELPELDMIQVQGILGSAIANQKMEENVPPWLNVPELLDAAAQDYLPSYNTIRTFITVSRSHLTSETARSHLDQLEAALQERVNQDQSSLLRTLSPQQRQQHFLRWSSELGTVIQEWSQGLPQGGANTHLSLLVNKVLPLVLRWEWGTLNNFLYQYNEVSIPACLSSQQHLHLVDGGLLVNVGYPSFLGPRRDIDLIIAPEYSAGDMFETLTLARDYAASVQRPFPPLDEQLMQKEKLWPRDCYVFEGNGTAPTVVFMPLFNQRNCKDPEEWSQKMEEFSTFQKSFNSDMILKLLQTAQENIRNNKETLLKEVHKALQRRRSRGGAGQGSAGQEEQGRGGD